MWLEEKGDLGRIGSAILQCLFNDVEHSRADILQLILTNITEYDGSREIQVRSNMMIVSCKVVMSMSGSISHIIINIADSTSAHVLVHFD